jgi:hypothetical protein
MPISTPRYRPPGARNPWPERIGLFALGLAIGLLLLGALQMSRQNALRRARSQQQQQQQVQPPASPAPGPGDAPPIRGQ